MKLKYQIDIPFDTAEKTLLHKEIIQSKPFLRNLYLDWYRTFVDEAQKIPTGKIVELGSGGGFLKEMIPNIITSDILPLATNDMTFSALNIPFSADSLSGLFMVDTFHHLPDARQFLNEANRVLKEGGKLIMVEPANSLWGRFIYTRFHHEPFEPKGNWQIPDTGSLSSANIALPCIVFVRDKAIFESNFPDLVIEEITFHTPLRYILSGGVSFKQLVPDLSYPFFRKFDAFLSSLSKQLSMLVTIKQLRY